MLNTELEPKPAPNFIIATLQNKCPRCRRGNMFTNNNAYAKLSTNAILDMPDKCSVCGQKFDMEPGFWFGTGYVSYALAVAISVTTFVACWVLIGISFKNNSIIYWLIFQIILLVVLQPWLMRLSRSVYIRFFIHYDEDYEQTAPKEFN